MSYIKRYFLFLAYTFCCISGIIGAFMALNGDKEVRWILIYSAVLAIMEPIRLWINNKEKNEK